ncbi:MAG: SDR family oxidoreductase [Actinomycetota bacterium]
MSSGDASTQPISVVTGANSGIGRATAIYLAERGHRVIGTVRSIDKATKLNAMAAERGVNVELAELDVAVDESVATGFADILDRVGHVDHLVNNAGIGGNGVVEETSSEAYHDVYNVNVVGAVRCAKAVLPQMRERGSGTIVNITSVAGRIGSIAQAPYVASKWALEGVSEELAAELAPFGIRVAIIEPGVTKSAIIAKNTEQPNATGAYGAHYRQMFQLYFAGRLNATDPFEVGEVVHEAIVTDSPRLRYHVSWAGAELAPMHDRIDDQDWIGLGEAIDDDEGYAQRFEDIFGLDIRIPEGSV